MRSRRAREGALPALPRVVLDEVQARSVARAGPRVGHAGRPRGDPAAGAVAAVLAQDLAGAALDAAGLGLGGGVIEAAVRPLEALAAGLIGRPRHRVVARALDGPSEGLARALGVVLERLLEAFVGVRLHGGRRRRMCRAPDRLQERGAQERDEEGRDRETNPASAAQGPAVVVDPPRDAVGHEDHDHDHEDVPEAPERREAPDGVPVALAAAVPERGAHEHDADDRSEGRAETAASARVSQVEPDAHDHDEAARDQHDGHAEREAESDVREPERPDEKHVGRVPHELRERGGRAEHGVLVLRGDAGDRGDDPGPADGDRGAGDEGEGHRAQLRDRVDHDLEGDARADRGPETDGRAVHPEGQAVLAGRSDVVAVGDGEDGRAREQSDERGDGARGLPERPQELVEALGARQGLTDVVVARHLPGLRDLDQRRDEDAAGDGRREGEEQHGVAVELSPENVRAGQLGDPAEHGGDDRRPQPALEAGGDAVAVHAVEHGGAVDPPAVEPGEEPHHERPRPRVEERTDRDREDDQGRQPVAQEGAGGRGGGGEDRLKRRFPGHRRRGVGGRGRGGRGMGVVVGRGRRGGSRRRSGVGGRGRGSVSVSVGHRLDPFRVERESVAGAALEAVPERVPVGPEPGTGRVGVVGGGVRVQRHAAVGRVVAVTRVHRQGVRVVAVTGFERRHAHLVEEPVDAAGEAVDALAQPRREGLGLRGLFVLDLADLVAHQLADGELDENDVAHAGDPLEEAPSEAGAILEVDHGAEVVGVGLVEVPDDVLRLLFLLRRKRRERVEEVDDLAGRLRVARVVLRAVPVGIGVRVVALVVLLAEDLGDVLLAGLLVHLGDELELHEDRVADPVEETVGEHVGVLATELLGHGLEGGLQRLGDGEGSLLPEAREQPGGRVLRETALVGEEATGALDDLFSHVDTETSHDDTSAVVVS